MTESTKALPNIAVVGLGIMGSAFARHLIDRGFCVHGFDTDPRAMETNAQRGVHVSSSLGDVVSECSMILTSLPSAAALDSTVSELTADRSILNGGATVVELSTLSLDCKARARDGLEPLGARMLDCPVSGTGAQAATRDIVLYASGDEAAYAECRSVFDAIARQSFFLGAFGNGMRMKFIANLLVAIHNVATAEALALADAAGMDLSVVLDVIKAGAGTSKILELRGPMMVRQIFEPATMKLDVWQKDMSLIAEFARNASAATPLFDATAPLYEAAIEEGLGAKDTAAVIEVVKQLGRIN